MNVSLPDGSVRELPDGASALDLAQSISAGLARAVLAAEVTEPGGTPEVRDLARPLSDGAAVRLLTWDDDGGKYAFWHSSAHLMAEALEALYPGIRLGIGPAIEGGFYYDVDLSQTEIDALAPDDLPAIEQKMKALAKENNRFEREAISKADAVAFFEEKGDPYKLELLEGLDDGSDHVLQAGRLHRPLPRPPHSGHEADQGRQAA